MVERIEAVGPGFADEDCGWVVEFAMVGIVCFVYNELNKTSVLVRQEMIVV